MRAEARNARRDQRKGAGAEEMEQRAERLESQARERATARSSRAYEDEAPPMILSGTEQVFHDDLEPDFEDRISYAVHRSGGDPDDPHDRAWAEIEAVDSGDPWR